MLLMPFEGTSEHLSSPFWDTAEVFQTTNSFFPVNILSYIFRVKGVYLGKKWWIFET